MANHLSTTVGNISRAVTVLSLNARRFSLHPPPDRHDRCIAIWSIEQAEKPRPGRTTVSPRHLRVHRTGGACAIASALAQDLPHRWTCFCRSACRICLKNSSMSRHRDRACCRIRPKTSQKDWRQPLHLGGILKYLAQHPSAHPRGHSARLRLVVDVMPLSGKGGTYRPAGGTLAW